MKLKMTVFLYSLTSGGAERIVSIFLAEFMKKYDVTLVLMNDTIEYKIPKDIPIYYLEKSEPFEHGLKKLFKIPFLAYKYYKFCKKNSIDISFSLLSRPNYISALASFFMKDTKIVLSELSMPSMQYSYNNMQSWINTYLIKFLYPRADLILPNSQGNLDDLKINFNIKNKMAKIHNILDLEMITTEAKESVNDVEFSEKTTTFITIGRLDEGKNHKLLIEAMNSVNNAQLIIIGDGVLRLELEKQIATLSLESKVFLLGKRSNPYKYLAKSDIFVFSSNHEGFPTVLLESLAVGVPIISTDCKSGPREILSPTSDLNFQLDNEVEYGEFGVLTPIKNVKQMITAMNEIIKDENMLNTYKKVAKIRAQEFSKSIISKQYFEEIEDL